MARPVYKSFKKALKNSKQSPICEDHGPDTCNCQVHFYRTASLLSWMKNQEGNESKSNVERLLEEEMPVTTKNFDDPKSVHKQCILVYSILLSQKRGKLIYIFQSANIIDKNVENTETYRTRLLHGLTASKELDSDPQIIIDEFEKEKWKFFPACFEYQMARDFVDSFRLPFFRRKKLKDGGTASVIQILVHEDFLFEDLKDCLEKPVREDDQGGKYYELAVKKYAKEQKHLYEQEVDAFKGISNQPGIVRYFGCYSHHDGQRRERTYNILLELGEMDLSEYFCQLQPPERRSEILLFWKSICKIAKAIDSIRLLPHRGEIYYGWHGDVKPENILLVRGDFKLADFGFAKFKKGGKVTGVPETYLKGGTESYGAPEVSLAEFNTQKVVVTQKIDTWSFGCVLSVATTWIVLGFKGIEAFQQLRLAACKKINPKDYTDAFHNGFEVLPEIRIWHNYLKECRRICDPFTSKILYLIDEHLLQGNLNKRLTSEKLVEELCSIIQYHRSMIEDNDSQEQLESCVLEALSKVEEPLLNTEHLSNEIDTQNPRAGDSLETDQNSKGKKIQGLPTSPSYRKDALKGSLSKKVDKVTTVVGEPSSIGNTITEGQILKGTISQDSASQPRPKVTTVSDTVATSNEENNAPHSQDLPLHQGQSPMRHQINNRTSQTLESSGNKVHELEEIWAMVKLDYGIVKSTCEYIVCNYSNAGTITLPKTRLTPIMRAVQESNTSLARLLLPKSVLTHGDLVGKTVLHHAVKNINPEAETEDFLKMIKEMVESVRPRHLEFLNALDRNDESPLYDCVGVGKLGTAELLIKLGAWVNPPKGSKMKDVFVHAARKGRKEILSSFMEMGPMKVKYDLGALKKDREVAPKIIHLLERMLKEKNEGSKSGHTALSFFRKGK